MRDANVEVVEEGEEGGGGKGVEGAKKGDVGASKRWGWGEGNGEVELWDGYGSYETWKCGG